ncbi:DUF484 family protein [Ectothiorhodospira mobilis]|uniref:Phytochrome sensor protein n=1 Tax=Ectothiorhodospira mobilis TaxID=195064 RepID=A0A1I4RJU8_ECTMO|nr:DUF484 family protein [Ectothiorhodospira mobilis]MCG5536019.1 DUF484 family protein [Ectothiorhodospira mobilis]SFM52495.1 hypothetical protein SAMN05421721_10838 [Ectothiorhodospira mobilis]
MSTPGKSALAEEAVTEATVEAYLRAHPDFFERHLPLLEVLRLPHPCGGAVSLMERQISVLREKNRTLERKLMELVKLARENERLSQRMHHLALGLMEAEDLDAVLATTQEHLRSEFRADAVVIRVCGDPARGMHFVRGDDPAIEGFSHLFEDRRPLCGRLSQTQLEALFPAQTAAETRSAVVVPLLEGSSPLGLLALGSQEASRFHPGMGTLFLGYLGEIVSHAVSRRLAPV